MPDFSPEANFTPEVFSPFEPETRNPFEVTWGFFPAEPGMDDLLTQAGDSLNKMFEKFKLYPLQTKDPSGQVQQTLYLGRYELAKAGEDLQYGEAKFSTLGKVVGFVDFLGGFPMECTELIAMVGEMSSRADLKAGMVAAVPGDGPTPAMPTELFAGYADDKILLNLIYLPTDYAKTLVKGLTGEPEPKNLHWWLRINFTEDATGLPLKFPYPGEFLFLAVRLMPDRYWGAQKSNPFLFSGNWIDTVYLSGATIKEIQPPDDDRSYPTYTVAWRKEEITGVLATDFSEYQIGDRVVILKDVETDKQSQLWKDDDMQADGTQKAFKDNKWVIAPLMFYGIDPEATDE